MKVTLKEVFESDMWIITEIYQGCDRMHRVNAKRRFPKADVSSFFSEWGSEKYLNVLSRNNYRKNIADFSCYRY